MKLLYQQPHLVPPMRLTVFDEMPPTPLPPPPSQLSQIWTQGRNLASRASSRASFSVKRKASKPSISSPQLEVDDLPFRKKQQFRPLQLSIYMSDNRLSKLPEFDALSFTDVGEMKPPPRAMLRTKSEEILQTYKPSVTVAAKPASMFERRRMSRVRRDTTSTVISTSRPPSEYDALHSHPVSWLSSPGPPAQAHLSHRPEHSIANLSPMEEEFVPRTMVKPVGGKILTFPDFASHVSGDLDVQEQSRVFEEELDFRSGAVNVGTTALQHDPQPIQDDSEAYFHTDYQTQKRINQWLTGRSHSSSLSTVKSSSTSSSFAEHRRKRSRFYLASKQAAPPLPLRLLTRHKRTMTASTVESSIDMDIISTDRPSPAQSHGTMTTAPEVQSRSGTIKSFSLPIQGVRVRQEVQHTPPCYAEVIHKDFQAEVMIKEIGGALPSPAVGVAF